MKNKKTPTAIGAKTYTPKVYPKQRSKARGIVIDLFAALIIATLLFTLFAWYCI